MANSLMGRRAKQWSASVVLHSPHSTYLTTLQWYAVSLILVTMLPFLVSAVAIAHIALQRPER
jgi:hypothetical protein